MDGTHSEVDFQVSGVVTKAVDLCTLALPLSTSNGDHPVQMSCSSEQRDAYLFSQTGGHVLPESGVVGAAGCETFYSTRIRTFWV